MATQRSVVARNFARREGWFKVWRKIFSHDIWLTCPDSWLRVFIALLGCTQYEDTTLRVGTQIIPITAGSLVIGSHEFATFCNVSRQQLRSALEYLRATNVITISTTTKFSIVSITNWGCYQIGENQNNQPDNHQNNQQSNQQSNHNKRSKEYKKNTGACPAIIEQYGELMFQRHPSGRRGSLSAIRKCLKSILAALPEAEWEHKLAMIDKNHLSMCQSLDWKKENGQFAKGLENWLAPTMGRYEHGASNGKPVYPRMEL